MSMVRELISRLDDFMSRADLTAADKDLLEEVRLSLVRRLFAGRKPIIEWQSIKERNAHYNGIASARKRAKNDGSMDWEYDPNASE